MSFKLLLILGLVIFLVAAYLLSNLVSKTPPPNSSPNLTKAFKISVVAKNLEIPWALAFLPAPPAGGEDGKILTTERVGKVKLIDPQGTDEPITIAEIKEVKQSGEGGLLGLALHPSFTQNNLVYLYYTYSSGGERTFNRVVRFKFENNSLKDQQIIIDQIPGAPNHNGGRIKFGPDGLLYISTGDAQNPSLAQDNNSLAGKILRVTDDGNSAPGNPFGNLVYSYGHRNVQGLVWDNQGRLWATEHGTLGNDEINLIEVGKNYGWPIVQGNQSREGIVSPVIQSGSSTWAPAGLAYLDNSLYFGGLRGQTLFQLNLNKTPPELRSFFEGEIGRIREVILGPDGNLYITTSNRDGRGIPNRDDDKILKINPQEL